MNNFYNILQTYKMGDNTFRKTISEQYRNFDGWCTIEKACEMYRVLQTLPPINTCVELGVFAGRSLIALGLAVKDNCEGQVPMVYGVDPWVAHATVEGTNDPANDEWWSKLDFEYFYKYTQNKVTENHLDKIVTLLRQKSKDAVTLFEDGSIQVIHQDSNHSEEISCEEVALWTPKLAVGGFWIFDDTNWPSTAKAQKELLEKGFVLTKSYDTWGLYRKVE